MNAPAPAAQALGGLTRRLGLTRPVVLAPMAGGIGTPELVAAVSEAGGLGSLGAAYLTPEQIAAAVAEVRARTARPFAVNLFAPGSELPVAPTAAQIAAAAAELAPFHAGLGLPPPALPARVAEDFGAQFAAVLEARPAVFSFAFGRLDAGHLTALRGRGILSIGTATGLAEARQLAQDGVDAVTVQGGAAGGHRGGWGSGRDDELAGTLDLTRRVAATLEVPVIVAGGLMTRADVQAALDAGASLAQCGTAFLRAAEAGTSAPYRAALAAGTAPTGLTLSFSGRPARGLVNALGEAVHSPLPYPYQNALTRELRAAGAHAGQADVLSLWAGEGYRLGREDSAAGILDTLWPR
ncbi:nitronate monooxygenase family protein [Deinococcus sp. Leaf326]|uniref:NAD(P)H-dependent flavin oxidoreductase n=1 Tax=Deinococcus sp. Leaf326 TaxID=1736338 RepID=UPI000AD9F76C|nr:nitronate monooxygenase [Deinococcus sp. Leaf326]